MPYKVAILGAGVGAKHLESYLALPELFRVAVICDLDQARAAPLVQRSGAAWSSSIDETIDRADLDIVDICLPPDMHKPAILQSLAAKKHVICEKPLVGSLRDLDEIETALEGSDRQLMPVFQYRFGHGVCQLHQLIALGLAGRPLVATLETHWNRTADYYAVAWRGTWAGELGGAIVSHAIHAHDLLAAILGPIKAVQARLATRVNDIETEDCAAIMLEMATGALVTSSITLGSADDRSRMRFCFSGLSAESGLAPYNLGALPWSFRARPPASQAEIDVALAAFKPSADGFTGQFERFHRALRKAESPPVTTADARTSLELITAIYLSDRSESRIELPLSAKMAGYDGWLPATIA